MMNSPRKLLLFGNIGSGKSTVGEVLARRIEYDLVGIDECRRKHSDGSAAGEALAWSHFFQAAQSPTPTILECVGGGPFMDLLRLSLADQQIQGFWINTPAGICLERVGHRGLRVPYPDFGHPIEKVVQWIEDGLPGHLWKWKSPPVELDGTKSVDELVAEILAYFEPVSSSSVAEVVPLRIDADWKRSRVSPRRTHHVIDHEPMYENRFDEVLPFHAPGLAPVDDRTGAYHITTDGKSAYSRRFARTFGFYQERAAVIDHDGSWYHILPDGEALYAERYAWCGNFQQGYCPVRDTEGSYFHITLDGIRSYSVTWRYTGDFREGSAVVQSEDGLHSHIREDGSLLHDCWYLDLDVYHKGFARAKDRDGWMHIQHQGEPIYERRFAMVEPFYNGQARVECFDGSLEVIDEGGVTLQVLRPATRSPFSELSTDMVGFWKTETIATAVKLGVPDALPGEIGELSSKLKLDAALLERLLRGLGELGIVQGVRGHWSLTEKGRYLRSDHPLTLADAAREYGGELRESWERLPEALSKDGSWTPPQVFLDVADDESRLASHHRMLQSYALHDYEAVVERLNIPEGAIVLDAGGGVGTLGQLVKQAHPSANVTVMDLPPVCEHGKKTLPGDGQIMFQPGDLFEPWPMAADVILLARVLHDWDDEQATCILEHARAALKSGGKLLVLEMVRESWNYRGSLCDLHLLACTGGKERTLKDYGELLHNVGLRITKTENVTCLTTVITAVPEKKYDWVIPPSVMEGLDEAPRDRPVAMLIRHSVRPYLPPGSAGDSLPLTEDGHRLSEELGAHLGTRLKSVSASPLLRTMQTGEGLVRGAELKIKTIEDRYLGDPGVYSHGGPAGKVWGRRGHESVMEHLVAANQALPGLANPDAAARYLVHHMLSKANDVPGIHAFVTHDSLVTATAAQVAGVPLTRQDWPLYLEAAFFWRDEDGVQVRYRHLQQASPMNPLVSLREDDVLELARRELARTVGLDCTARFYLAGGVYKSLLHGRPPKDLDIWAATESDRVTLIEHLTRRGGEHLEASTYTDVFQINGRLLEIKKHVKPEHANLDGVTGGFDLVLSAIAVEHLGRDRWRVYVHPKAWSSYCDGIVLVFDEFRNWRHTLATLVRMQEYGEQLGLAVPESEVERIWSIFRRQPQEMKLGMIERFRNGSHHCEHIEQQARLYMEEG